jgi:DNA-binding beta-propeller fold protein YncE
MMVLDSESGRVVTGIPIGKGVDGAEFDAGTGLAFSPNGADSTVTVIHEDSPDKFTVVQTAPSQRGARTIALDPRTHRLYLAAAEYGETPAPTADHPHPRPPMIPGSFVIQELAP